MPRIRDWLALTGSIALCGAVAAFAVERWDLGALLPLKPSAAARGLTADEVDLPARVEAPVPVAEFIFSMPERSPPSQASPSQPPPASVETVPARLEPTQAPTLQSTPHSAAPPPTAATGIVISLADRRLYLVGADTSVRSFPVAIARHPERVPLGTSKVVAMRRNPTWYPTKSMRERNPGLPASVPPGPKNPLGAHAIELGWKHYFIHGTNEPASVGRLASAGCFRMLAGDIETVFQRVAIGTPVTVRRESWRPDAAKVAAVTVKDRS